MDDRPVIVCGLGRVGKRVLDYVRAAGLAAVVVEQKLDASSLPPGVGGISGDCRQADVLERAGVRTARGVLVCTSDDLVNIATGLTVRGLNPDVRIVIRVFNQSLIGRLGRMINNVFALSVSALSAPLLAQTALTGELLAAFPLADGPRQIVSVTVADDSRLLRRTIAEVADRYRCVPLAHLPPEGDGQFLLDVRADARLAVGDRLVVCGEPRDLARVLGREEEHALVSVRWAGWMKRFGRVARRALAEIDLPVKIATGTLLAVLLGSTLVYHFGMDESVPSALYHTVSVIATGADLRAEQLLPWQKVFVSALRIAGAALTAAFTAIVTQYLLRARLGGAFEVRRIPDGGHVVVCGLGNVGFRVAEELLRLDEQVVVIEPARDNRFLASARRLGAAVVPGDATLPEVMRQARVDSARAVVVATNNELANVEIALLVREINPQQRVVVRLSDPHLAQTLRESSNVRLALSLPAMAAPAFVAALFGDRVQAVFRVGGRLLMVVELAVQAGDPCLDGQTVRAAAIDYALMPVSVAGPDGAPRPEPHSHRLGPDDRLTAVTGLADLERLFRREQPPRDWAVEVHAFPLTARPQLVLLVQSKRGIPAEEATVVVDGGPFVLDRGLTHGQAEDAAAALVRERVGVKVIRQTD
ncbi:MAG TPA: NAD-binding protein [Gemmataceae bacterium]|nr:NAD-binding protein [Gemmataceae bacterium]